MDLDPALSLIMSCEGCKLTAYLDPIGIPTIGYGTTSIHGEAVPIGLRITLPDADRYLIDDCERLALQIKTHVNKTLNNNELCALVSFCYNVGIGAFYHSTMLRLLNQGSRASEVAAQFKIWCRAGGVVLPGLVKRRAMEADLFLTADVS